VRVSYGRATCAGHKQEYVRNELGPPSTQLGPQMHSLAWLGQGLCPAQHAISMSRGPPTTPTTAASRRRGRCSPGGAVEQHPSARNHKLYSKEPYFIHTYAHYTWTEATLAREQARSVAE